ncbi:kinase-like protein [Trematosphaeria pertusa]|uniref:EKC/KEOPS complex subunit BUD32 n=1 Tax=Trematosphaeria pertusa TaxID=390896 RepID=A0A6A6HTY4_9PLEO|nr:kinase-like protein [Trematosphaeria pertusa]KAF2241379.1 kinase-like protein [Trematosphaeria pertusa]
MTRGTLYLPSGTSSSDIIGGGTSGLAILYPGTRTVLKISHGDPDEDARCELEAQIYDLLSKSQLARPSSLLEYKGRSSCGRGILLGYAENHTVRRYLRSHGTQPPDTTVIHRWANQAALALHFLHMNGISHGDVTCDNFFLDKDLNVQLGDFTIRANHRFPGPLLSTDADIFSLGSAHYTIMTGKLPYQDLSEKEITALFKEGRFPETDTLGPFGAIIRKCWQVKYKSVVDVYKDIEGMILRLD